MKKRVILFAALLITYFAVHYYAATKHKDIAVFADGGPRLLVIMYHQLTANPRAANQHILLKDEFEADIVAILNAGYTPVTAGQLIAYTDGGCVLPEKPILITFDDGNLCFYNHAYPVLQKYGVPVVFSPVASWVEKETARESPTEYVTIPLLKEMLDSGLVELGNHSYDMHSITSSRRGVLRGTNESPDTYARILTGDISKAQEYWAENLGVRPEIFVYPYGFSSDASEGIMRSYGFKITLGCWEKINTIASGVNLFRMCRVNRSGAVSSGEFMKRVNEYYCE